jgi:lysine/ornithine N-monooxygenase
MRRNTDLLIVGAGPFGLAMYVQAAHQGIHSLVVGHPMQFWRAHMPPAMLLRSACDWHLDPLGIDTIDAFLQTRQLRRRDVEPLSLDFYLQYVEWFMQRKQIQPLATHVERLDGADDGFEAVLENGDVVEARQVLLAVGFEYFKHVPTELAAMLPAERYSHTGDVVGGSAWRVPRCLIVGGRQSAFEWAALLREHGVAAVEVSYRHATPAFEPSDWSFVEPLMQRMVDDPGWYRRLTAAEKEALNAQFWAEGRLKLEPWLWPRVNRDGIRLWPASRLVSCEVMADDALRVGLEGGASFEVDHVVLATGYRVDLARIPFLRTGNLWSRLPLDGGFTPLDEHMQSRVPGLFVTSMAATRDFGSFFAFTVSARASAQIVSKALRGVSLSS